MLLGITGLYISCCQTELNSLQNTHLATVPALDLFGAGARFFQNMVANEDFYIEPVPRVVLPVGGDNKKKQHI